MGDESLELALREKMERASAAEAARSKRHPAKIDEDLIQSQKTLKAAHFDNAGQWLGVFHDSMAQAIRDIAAEKDAKSKPIQYLIALFPYFYLAAVLSIVMIRGTHNVDQGNVFLEYEVLALLVVAPLAGIFGWNFSMLKKWWRGS